MHQCASCSQIVNQFGAIRCIFILLTYLLKCYLRRDLGTHVTVTGYTVPKMGNPTSHVSVFHHFMTVTHLWSECTSEKQI